MGDPLAEWTSSSISGSLHKLTLAKLQPDSLYEVEMAANVDSGLDATDEDNALDEEEEDGRNFNLCPKCTVLIPRVRFPQNFKSLFL